MKINKISPDKHDYLQILSNIAKKPKALYYLGKLPETRQPTIAIVGTRKPTSYGREVTIRFASELAKRGVIVVSGLALGTDGIAHRATLEVKGTTIAILGNGLPTIYPSSHRELASQIISSGGALLSEYQEGTLALPHQFLERNRLVAGLADALLITEAAARSGTLNTAMHALEQGKEIFVIPGNITNPMSAGCNALIRQGATLVTSPEQILESIAPATLAGQQSLPLGSSAEETTILELLQSGVRDGDELLQKSNLDAQMYAETMTMLEINGQIRALGANQWTLR